VTNPDLYATLGVSSDASADEIKKETPALRRLREKFGGDLKGGLG